MVVVAIDAHQRGAIDLGVENLRRLQVGGNQDEGLQAQPRGMRGNGVGQIPGRRAANRVESECLRIGQRHGHHAILEAQRGHADGVVLDVEIARADALGQARRLHQRRKAGRRLRLIAVRHRQQGAITPHVQRSLRDGLAGKAGAGVLEVEDHLKRGKTLIADRKRLNPVGLAAFPTSQFVSSRHKSLAYARVTEDTTSA